MKIVHVVPSIAEEASGPSYSVPRLCEALLAQGQDVSLAALAWTAQARQLPYLKTFPMDTMWPRRLGSSRALRRWLDAQVASMESGIVHNHGMWQMNALYPAWAARNGAGRCKLVASPRGALSTTSMRHGSVTKKLFWPWLQHPALRAVDCFHATSDAEYADIRRLGFRQPVAVVPNGVDIPTALPEETGSTLPRTLLFLGRIHPIKGLDLLLPAWASLQHRFPDWQLRIVGDDAGYGAAPAYLAKMRQLATALGAARVDFAGKLQGPEKWAAYQQAELFVLPSYSENFAVAVAEALASATPAIVSRGAPWSCLQTTGAGWWVETSQDTLTTALAAAMSRSTEELASMGCRGRQWVGHHLAWNRIGTMMQQTYTWLHTEQATPPTWVALD